MIGSGGFQCAREIINSLARAGVEVVEVGFLRNVEEYNQDISVCNHIEELNRLLPENSMKTPCFQQWQCEVIMILKN